MSLESESMEMPIGKFKGEKVIDVPTDYLMWALETWDFRTRRHLLKAMEDQIAMRLGQGVARETKR